MKSIGVKRKRPAVEEKPEFLDIDSSKPAKFEERFLQIVQEIPEPKKSLPPDIRNIGESSILNKVKNFLPKIDRANVELKKELAEGKGENFNLENIENSDQIIEMELSLVPGGCSAESIPSPVRDLLDNSEEKSDSSDDDSAGETNHEDKKNKLIEEMKEKT